MAMLQNKATYQRSKRKPQEKPGETDSHQKTSMVIFAESKDL
jgi:hypothetical protein